jgi:hypothetical protein
MGNRKSEILGTPKPWNVETLEHWNFRNRSLIPYGEKDLVHHHIYCPSSPMGKERKA